MKWQGSCTMVDEPLTCVYKHVENWPQRLGICHRRLDEPSLLLEASYNDNNTNFHLLLPHNELWGPFLQSSTCTCLIIFNCELRHNMETFHIMDRTTNDHTYTHTYIYSQLLHIELYKDNTHYVIDHISASFI